MFQQISRRWLLLAILPLTLGLKCDLRGPSADPATKDWPMASYDAVASGHNTRDRQIGVDNVAELEVKWVFDEEDAGHPVGPVHASPVVKGNHVYVGTNFGRFYALDRDGSLLWEVETRQPNPLLAELVVPTPVGGPATGAVATPVTGAAVLPRHHPLVIFGDLDGNIYALHRNNGREVWMRPLNPHPLGGIVGNSLLLAGETVVIGFSSIENLGLVLPDLGLPYDCCDHTGFVVALDVATGAERWRFDTIDPGSVGPLPPEQAPFDRGPSGADIWGQPTLDESSDTIFIGTGQNFSPTAEGGSTGTSDAIIALDADSGAVRWITQLTQDDIWVTGIPNPTAGGRYLDQDVGDSPKVYTLPDGRRVVGAGQKSGVYHVLDAATGEIIASTPHLRQANSLGGFQQGGAIAGDLVFQHGLDRLNFGLFNGVVTALSLDGSEERWRFQRLLTAPVGSLAVSNGVLFFQSPVDEPSPFQSPPQWALYGLEAETGSTLLRVPFDGRAISSPVISRGRVYLGKGNTAVAELGSDPEGGVISLGLPEE
jgi:polyvinyl alcohol dehydrogenase (cytochrome)